MPERNNGKKNAAGTTLDLLGEEPVKPRAVRKPAPAPVTAPEPEMGGALFGGEDVDMEAKHPANVPVGNFPAPSQIAQAADPDPFGEEDPFEDSVMARMLADEPAPIASPLRAAREDFQMPSEAVPVTEPEPVAEPELLTEPEPVAEIEAEPMTEAGPDLDAFADPVAAPEVEQPVELPAAEADPEPAAEALPEPVADTVPELAAEPISEVTPEPELLAVPEPPPAPAKKAKAAPADKPAPGMTFERRYTEAGQDVWATADWELRTASIVGSDGKVVFEQSGVEIPKAWSQLATNVVVSKYFRGQIGTLEREYSVKQLIGRVADRIVEWGREGDYFASDADAEVFHDELRYILLHQHAAFNSPVWFNLGWAGRRQAVSACLPYDVRVNTDRGLLPIGEIVRLFGANPQAQIFTFAPDGSPSRIVAAVCNGRKRVFRYHLADGSTLRCTSNHRVFVRGDKGEIVEKEAGNLVAGVDRLILSRSVLLPKTTVQDLHSLTPDTDLAWLTGLMVGDGYCGRSQSLTSDTWDLKINTVPEKDRAEAVLTKYGVPFRTHIKSWGFCLRGHGAVSRAFWSALGLWGRVGDKQVPEWIYRTGAKNVGAFLGGLFDADGHVSQNENRRLPVFSNTSLPLVQAAQTLLRSLGIYAALTAYTDSRDDYARKTSYSLGIHDNLSVEQFEVHVGFTHAEKQARVTERQLAIASSLRASDVLLVSKTQGGSEYVYDIQTESETFWAEGILLHNCYITEVNDTMESILDLYKTEGMLFKDGSGSGQNLSSLRSSKEPLAAGGRSSGPIAFMKGLDASAGSIKSGGSTRRAAKMVILDADHPDIQEFVDCKKDAELKAHALIDAGYSGAFNVANGAYDTVPFQNANHSVRVTDQFMQAVEADGPWETKFRTTGETAETLRAKDLLHSIAEGTWVCLPPGELILTENGERPIETIQPGDQVWTHKGRLARVDHPMVQPFSGDLVEISVNGYHRMLVTDNHPVLVSGYKSKADFLPAGKVSVGDYLMVPNFRPSDGRKTPTEPQSTAFLRLLGYYLAEGSVEDDRGTPSTTRFTFHINEVDYVDDVLSLIKEAFDKTASVRVLESHNVREVVVCSRAIAAAFMHFCGRGAASKCINEELFVNYDSVSLLELVDTWLRGDGHDRVLNMTHRQLTGRTVSEQLARGIFRILVMNRLKPTMRRDLPVGKKPVYSISLFGRCAGRFYDRVPRGRGYLRYKVQSVRRIPYTGQVYNLNLDRDSTFLTNFFVVHNCGDPGMQFDTISNDWHTCASTDRIYASNPCCFVGETLIETAEGQIPFAALYARHEAGEDLPTVFSFDRANRLPALQAINKVWIAGHTRELVEVKTERGLTFRCTPEHRFLTQSGEYVEARHLAIGTALCSLRCAAKDLPEDQIALQATLAEAADVLLSVTPLTLNAPVPVYDMEVEGTHNFAITDGHSAGLLSVVVSNSEFFFLNSTACNLSSLNLMKFREAGSGAFDTASFEHAVKIMITAQEIMVGFAHYPTEKITQRSHDYRPLGLGYANLGALLMAAGLPYDSDAGRAYAGAVTSLMTGRAYHQSAQVARDCGGPFAGYAHNREPMLRVMGKHRAAVDDIDAALIPETLLQAARTAWDETVELGTQHGYRNAQATVLAPTGCLVAGSLVITDRGVVRLNRLGDAHGAQWQDVRFGVLTDTGQQQATKFYVNGRDATRRITTRTGYAIQGTPKHRVKVVDAATGQWDWKRFGDIVPGDVVALSMGQMLGEPQAVTLPPLGEEYWTGDYTTRVPRTMTADLAELIGYFMGDGSMHAKGPRFCVANTDLDVAERVQFLVKSLFNLDAHLTPQQGYCEVAVHSVPLTLWWEACGFAKLSPGPEHSGKGYLPRIPDAVLATNDPAVYGAFLRGLYEADGTVTGGVPCWSTVHRPFSEEVKTLLLALGIPTSTKQDTTGWGQSPLWVLRLRNTSYTSRYREAVGFMSARKAGLVSKSQSEQAARHDYIYLAPEVIAELVPKNSPLYNAITLSQKRHPGAITRRSAEALYAATQEARVGHALRFFYDVIASNEDGGEQLTYDLSVPANVTYIAQGFVSHNTIGFLMDCDTTGIEPDIAIVKYKSLVGGGMMKIVNQTVPEALERLGYSEAERQSIIAFIDEHDTIEGATDLKPEHLPIFDCAFRPMNGTRSIHYRGHIKMMAAAQPFISGAISKCVTGETLLATGRGLVRIGSLYQNEKPDTFRPARLPLASLGGTRETDAFYYGGGKPTLGVTLRSGHRITGTPNHRLLVAREGRLDWVRLDEIEPGEAVATQYGTDLWADTAPRLPVLTTPLHGSEKRVALPETMTEELAWLLGAYAAEGHTTRSNWTVTLTNSVDAVLERAVQAWQSEFGVKAVIERQPGKCPGVRLSSKRIVLWMEALGCGARASAKRIPDAILQSPRPMVLSFLSGLMLDGYAVPEGTLARVALCLDAPLLLDDLQAILTNLGLVHSRISKKNNTSGKTYDEVYLAGEWAQQFARLVPFMEPDKAASAARLLTRTFAQSTADVVPGITPRELLALVPLGKSGHNGKGTSRGEFNFLADPRTKQVSRRTLERVAAHPGVVLSEWLQIVLRDNLRFSPVTEVKETGVQTVYDVSVPVTHAFVGNGIVNHNTVNLPNSATPDDIAETYMEAWKLGIKAVAVYRDGSKRTQPLNMGKETPAADKTAVQSVDAETSSATLIPTVPKAVRRRLPNERDGVTHKFSIGGHEGYLTVGLYPDTRQPGEIFIRMSKEGSSISGLMDSFATAISLALQYGVPLQTLVDKFIHSRFEPSGFTGNKEIPMAKSVMDYIFRYLALRFLQAEDRHNVGLLADQPADDAYPAHDTNSGTLSNGNGTGDLSHLADTRTAALSEHEREIYRAQSDAPPCPECGAITIRNGACYRCVSCGTSLGCS